MGEVKAFREIAHTLYEYDLPLPKRIIVDRPFFERIARDMPVPMGSDGHTKERIAQLQELNICGLSIIAERSRG